jgi:membrane-bound ClpP family serine protease
MYSIPNSQNVTKSGRMLVALIGITSLLITFKGYNKKWINRLFILLGTVGLSALLVALIDPTKIMTFGLVGAVVSAHALVLPKIGHSLKQLHKKKYGKKCSK